jgi:hypothetical protein
MVFRIVLSIEDCLMVGIRILVGLFGWICLVTLLMVELELGASKMNSFLQGLKVAFLFISKGVAGKESQST